jgi:hypothetical protein
VRITPYWGTSLDRFAELISKGKETPLIPTVDFTLSKPIAVSNILPRNTRITITFNKPGFIKNQEGRYTRLNIAVLDKLPAGSILPVYVPTVPFKIHDILDEINFALGLSLDPSEVENTRYSTIRATYQLRTFDSIAWTGNYTFKATQVRTWLPLENVISDKVMAGFKYPLPTKPGLSGKPVNRWEELLKIIHVENVIRPPLTDSEVKAGKLTILTTDDTTFLNTKITVMSLPDGHYKNNVDVSYHRISLAELTGNFDLITEDTVTPQSLLDFINARGGTDITLYDVDEIIVPSDPIAGLYEVFIKPQVNNIKYCGSKKIQMLFGFSSNIEKLHILMNHTLPSEGYLT